MRSVLSLKHKHVIEVEKGFSLIEILVAIAILSVGILATASMQGAASRSNVIADTRTRATTLATDRIEKLVTLSWTDANLADADGDGQAGLNDTGGDADHNVLNGEYTVYWNVADHFPITDTNPNKIIDTKTIRVIVTWKLYGGVRGRVAMERVIPKMI